MAVRLYAGADAKSVQGRPLIATGYRCFSAAYGPYSPLSAEQARETHAMLDSGAFSDSPAERLTPEGALERQLTWERKAAAKWGCPGWQAEALVSYDLLIDEVWTGKKREKRRWSIQQAEQAVEVTVQAAAYLSAQRERISPRRLVLACQGVDARQYAECAERVLAHVRPGDVIGLGGWCILGWFRSWVPTFWATMRLVLPQVQAAGVRDVHLFGVLYLPVLGGLLWLADRHGIEISTDGSGPVLAPSWPNKKKAGARADTWEANVAWWRDSLANLRASEHYTEPPAGNGTRQAMLF